MRIFFCAAAVLTTTLGSAQIDSIQQIEEVVISGHRSPSTLEQVARSVTIISAEEIKNAPVQSLSELLEFTMSIDIRQRGRHGVQSDVSIRGGSFDQTLILVNGIKMTDPQTGHHSMNLPVDLNQVERIEVLHGGGSRIFGPNAFAGAINIITKTTAENSAGAAISGGENGFYSGRLHTTINTGKWNHSVSYARRGSEGYAHNTDFQWQNLFVQSAAQLDHHKLIVNAGWNQKEFGASTFYSALYPNQFEATQTRFVSISDAISLTPNLTVTPRAYYREHRDRFELFREGSDYYTRSKDGLFIMDEDTVASWYTGHNYHRTISWGAELNTEYRWKGGVSSVGVDYRSEEIRSNALGEPLENPISVAGEHHSALYSRFGERQNLSLYAEHNLNWKKLFVSAGALYNMNTEFEDELFPGIDVAYQLGNHFRPYASWNRSVRFPTYTDLYYNLGGAVGSIELEPESSINYEIGTKFFSESVTGVVTVFRREGQNLIDWIRYNDSEVTQASNLTTVNVSGLELGAQFRLREWLGERAMFSMVKLSYTYMQADTASRGYESNYVLDFLEHKFNAVAIQRISDQLSVQWNASYQQRTGGYFSPAEEREIAFEPVLLLDVRLNHRSEWFDVFVEVANLFNETYVDIGNVPQPGRWLRAGIAVNIGF